MSFNDELSQKLLEMLRESTLSLDLDLSAHTQQKLIDYLSLLSKWNKTYNLTAIGDPEQMLIKHGVDSLVVVPYITGKRLIDVGSGGRIAWYRISLG